MLRLANGFAAGHAGVRPVLAQRLVQALDRGDCPVVRQLGSLGESDLAPLADLAADLFADADLAAGEGLALLDNNAFSTGAAALAVHDARRLLDAADAAGALSLEAFAANLTILHPAVVAARPDGGLERVVERLRRLLDGSYLWRAGSARNLQDPLTFRSLAAVHGACHDAMDYVERRLDVELNAAQGNPLVDPGEDRLISVADFETLALAAALDLARIALAPLLTSADERALKLLETPWSGLPTGLAPASGTAESGLSMYAIAGEAMTAEARLLAQPVSFELASSAGAEGIEDRATMLPLGARRLTDMADLGERIVAIELLLAAQAVELRGSGPLGRGTRRVFEAVRERVPFVGAGDPAAGRPRGTGRAHPLRRARRGLDGRGLVVTAPIVEQTRRVCPAVGSRGDRRGVLAAAGQQLDEHRGRNREADRHDDHHQPDHRVELRQQMDHGSSLQTAFPGVILPGRDIS